MSLHMWYPVGALFKVIEPLRGEDLLRKKSFVLALRFDDSAPLALAFLCFLRLDKTEASQLPAHVGMLPLTVVMLSLPR